MKINGVEVGPNSPLITPARAKRLLAPDERDHQVALLELLVGPARKGGARIPGEGLTGRYPELLLVYAVNPNKGGQRSRAARGIAKAMGLLADMPDLCLPVMRGPFIGLYVEMKRQGSRSTPEQIARQEQLRAEGHCVIECQSVEEGRDVFLGYLDLPKNRPSARPITGSPVFSVGTTLAERIVQWRFLCHEVLTPNRESRKRAG